MIGLPLSTTVKGRTELEIVSFCLGPASKVATVIAGSTMSATRIIVVTGPEIRFAV